MATNKTPISFGACLFCAWLMSLPSQSQGGSITLSVSPVGVQSGESFCPNTTVLFTCVANQVAVLIWARNDVDVATFTSRHVAPTQEDADPFVAFLNSSATVTSGGINATSTLIATSISDLQSGDNIECRDRTGKSIVLDYTIIGTPPAPSNYTPSVDGDIDSATFVLNWNEAFNSRHNIDMYKLEVSGDTSINCPSTCAANEQCVCSALTDGNSNITVSAINCEVQEGPPTVITIKPRIPPKPSFCRILPVYNESGRLTHIGISWNEVADPQNLTYGVSQEVLNYSVSLGRTNNVEVPPACSKGRTSCLKLFNLSSSPSMSLSDVSVAARNIIGSGPNQTCYRPMNNSISPTNTVLSFNVIPDNRMVTITCAQMNQESGLFFCEFCYGRDTCEEPTMCLNVTISTATQIPDGRYCYRVTAVHNEVPIALIQDYFTVPQDTSTYTILLAITVPIWIVSLIILVVESVIGLSCIIRFCLSDSEQKREISGMLWFNIIMTAVAGISLVLSLILIIVYLINSNDSTGRNSLATGCAFSVCTFFLSINRVCTFVYTKFRASICSNRFHPEDDDTIDPHRDDIDQDK